jgi:hypothetical protein
MTEELVFRQTEMIVPGENTENQLIRPVVVWSRQAKIEI